MRFETNLLKCKSHKKFKEIGDVVQNGLEDLRETASLVVVDLKILCD